LHILLKPNRKTEENITQWFNEIDTKLKFELTVENNSRVSFLDINIQRKPDKIELGVYRKETNKDINIEVMGAVWPTLLKRIGFRLDFKLPSPGWLSPAVW